MGSTMDSKEFDLYKDIRCRTNGEIYIGVVGPVRTGKSTFIKHFMELCVIPKMDNEYAKKRAVDEMPQSGKGKTIMTTEPKFIPQDAVTISLDDGSAVKVRLVDCVGFTVGDAVGYLEEDGERMVKTPWLDEDIPFEEAAVVGTKKVIEEHSTVAVLVTTDGSIGDIKRQSYEAAERETVMQLETSGKTFVIGRFDAGMMYYTPQIWCSDNTDALDRLQISWKSSYMNLQSREWTMIYRNGCSFCLMTIM